jgi:hypothetical protein
MFASIFCTVVNCLCSVVNCLCLNYVTGNDSTCKLRAEISQMDARHLSAPDIFRRLVGTTAWEMEGVAVVVKPMRTARWLKQRLQSDELDLLDCEQFIDHYVALF